MGGRPDGGQSGRREAPTRNTVKALNATAHVALKPTGPLRPEKRRNGPGVANGSSVARPSEDRSLQRVSGLREPLDGKLKAPGLESQFFLPVSLDAFVTKGSGTQHSTERGVPFMGHARHPKPTCVHGAQGSSYLWGPETGRRSSLAIIARVTEQMAPAGAAAANSPSRLGGLLWLDHVPDSTPDLRCAGAPAPAFPHGRAHAVPFLQRPENRPGPGTCRWPHQTSSSEPPPVSLPELSPWPVPLAALAAALARPLPRLHQCSRPADEGLWDVFVKDVPRGATSYSISLDRLRPGVTYEFRVAAVNQLGYGEPSRPSAAVSAQADAPFYAEWWFLLVLALSCLVVVLLAAFALVLRGQSRRYRSCSTGKGLSHVEESVTLDNGGFAALELNSRHLSVKNTFSKKNGTRSPPRPSPGGLHYSDEDICNKYNGAALAESMTLQEKSVDASESEGTDSESEDAPPPHSFVNHYLSDPTYCGSWKRRAPGGRAAPHRYEAVAAAEAPPLHTVVTTQSAVFAPAGLGARTPLTGFSSFV
ncbi:protein sidekick-1-like [Phyllostomus discolor]|uniref:Protein sidekick-1-like n=1 Tax=Phyllostomus discolor TaxID=89673 RepID=A0A7E6CRN3_9CHIR|nr:protein sidekick-1-like [Phyllostomus discolor]